MPAGTASATEKQKAESQDWSDASFDSTDARDQDAANIKTLAAKVSHRSHSGSPLPPLPASFIDTLLLQTPGRPAAPGSQRILFTSLASV